MKVKTRCWYCIQDVETLDGLLLLDHRLVHQDKKCPGSGTLIKGVAPGAA